MLAKRIIPCLDIKDGRIVKGINFKDLMDAGDPVSVAKRYYEEGADELAVLDISATNEGRATTFRLIEDIATNIFMPLTVGGGIKTLEHIDSLLKAGADKISINSAAVLEPEFVALAADKFGTQCIVIAVDIKQTSSGKWKIFTHGGKQDTGIDMIQWVIKMEQYGAGEILLTSMDRDGTGLGYDLQALNAIGMVCNLPIIASGGAGTLEHLREGFITGGADAALVASMFHFGTYSISQAKNYLNTCGVEMRL